MIDKDCLLGDCDEEQLDLIHDIMIRLQIYDYDTAIDMINTAERKGNLEFILLRLLREE